MTDLFTEAPIEIVDRSTLERYSNCPAQARAIELGEAKNAGFAAASGEAVHQAISAVLTTFREAGVGMSPMDIRNELETELRNSRPDVQPDAIRAFRPSLWGFANYLKEIHPLNIIRYDGGHGPRSGQLAWDVDRFGVRVTSEIDLLHATDSKELLAELDWKSGWRTWTEHEVRTSFQFQMHPWLILNNYPDVQAVRITIWNTRAGKRTWPVEITRNDLPEINSRIMSALGEWHLARNKPFETLATWPTVEKCSLCPIAYKCPAADKDVRVVETDTEAFMEHLVATDAKLKALEKLAASYVDRTGKDLVGAGAAFGTEKPKQYRKPTKGLYAVKGIEDAGDTPPAD